MFKIQFEGAQIAPFWDRRRRAKKGKKRQGPKFDEYDYSKEMYFYGGSTMAQRI